MKFSTVFILLCLYSYSLSAQHQYATKGNLIDSTANTKLTNATITILNSNDSTIFKFKWTKQSSSFHITGLQPGSFILLASCRGYADYTGMFQLDSLHPVHDFQDINMLLKSRLLTEVIIQGKAATFKLKGDTLEYNADAFKVQPNAKVEDLLKQFPGIEVDQTGRITAQGKTVNKVLLDGEEFFGDDPTLLTKNVRADMVDKVQLYDRTSDQATFSGMDDGKKEKTLNIQLKEDKKNGYFGQIVAGLATDKYYRGKAMFNSFKGKERISAFGNIDNTGRLGLNFNDNNKYGMSANNAMFGDEGLIIVMADNNDELETFNGNYNGEGFPLARTGGLHYDNKLNNDKVTVNGNYKIGSLNTDGNKEVLTQNNLPSSFINTKSNQSFNNYIFRQKLDAITTLKLNTSSNLKITAGGSTRNSSSANSYLNESRRADSSLLNNNNRTLNDKGTKYTFNAAALYTKEFKKAGRKFSWNISEDFNSNKVDGSLVSIVNYYNKTGTLDSTTAIDQKKQQHATNSILTSVVTFTEPLSPKLTMNLNYNIIVGSGTSNQQTFGKSEENKYDRLDSSLSSNYTLDQLSSQGGVSFKYSLQKMNVSIGSMLTNVSFKQINLVDNSTLKRNFLNLNPQGTIVYNFSNTTNLTANYVRRTTLPTLSQMQPLSINNDPLNIKQGNPDLHPTFSHDITLGYSSYKILTERMIWFNGYYSVQNSPIVPNVMTDSAGKSTYQFSNINKNASALNLYLVYNKKIKSLDITFSSTSVLMNNTGYNLVNTVLNKSTAYDISQEVGIKKSKDNLYSLNLNAGPVYNIRRSSLQPLENSDGLGLTANGDVEFYLPAHFYLWSDFNYKYRAKTNTFPTDFSRFLWNISFSRTFLKQQNLKLTMSVNDLLNQNVGFDRSVSGNTIVQNSFSTVRRYCMFTITWDFNKMGSSTAK
jgi:hypothetical protein